MSIAGILSSNALSGASTLQSSAKQKQTEFQQLAQALQTGNLSSAQQVFGALTQNAPSSTAILNTQLGQDFSSLGSDLQTGNLAAAQKAYAAVQQDVQNAGGGAQVRHHHHHGGHVAPNPTTAPSSSSASGSAQSILAELAGVSMTA
ncbi:MAG: hypothetical protein WB421_14905 [Terriglobales bacterium]